MLPEIIVTYDKIKLLLSIAPEMIVELNRIKSFTSLNL